MHRQRSKDKYNKLHSEIISKRHQKKEKKKKKSISKIKKQKVKEYLELEKLNESQEKKTTAMILMNLIEEIKDEGMNDKKYMDIMDNLMILHKQDEKKIHVLVVPKGEYLNLDDFSAKASEFSSNLKGTSE